MLIYFDSCALNRPRDHRDQPRIAAEAEAMEVLLALCLGKGCSLLASDVLYYEAMLCTDAEKQAFVKSKLALGTTRIAWSRRLISRANELELRGFKSMDSWHLVSAEAGLADRFCSCDTRLVNRAKRQTDLSFQVVTPLELLEEILK